MLCPILGQTIPLRKSRSVLLLPTGLCVSRLHPAPSCGYRGPPSLCPSSDHPLCLSRHLPAPSRGTDNTPLSVLLHHAGQMTPSVCSNSVLFHPGGTDDHPLCLSQLLHTPSRGTDPRLSCHVPLHPTGQTTPCLSRGTEASSLGIRKKLKKELIAN